MGARPARSAALNGSNILAKVMAARLGTWWGKKSGKGVEKGRRWLVSDAVEKKKKKKKKRNNYLGVSALFVFVFCSW